MNPREFLQVAVETARSKAAARRRTAIGRAYYACYHVAIEWLRGLGFDPGKGTQAHGAIRDLLVASQDEEISDAARILNALRGKRVQADYYLDNLNIEDPLESLNAIQIAQEFIDILDSCDDMQRRKSIAAAIKQNN